MREIARTLASAQSVLMSLHRQPDGDSIGSTLAIARALTARGQDVLVVTPDPVPRAYDFLPGADGIVGWEAAEGRHFDLVALFDCADERRCGAPHPLREYAPKVLNVDHHPSNDRYGDIVLVDDRAAASGEIAVRVLDALEVPLDRELALLLYVAIETDTGGFRYSSTTAASHRLVARLLDTGLEPGEIFEKVYERQAVSGLRLLGAALQSLKVREDLSLAYVVLGQSDFARAGAAPEDVETLGIVDYARRLEGIEVGALLREESPEQVKLSLRAKGRIDVAELAKRLGGGGHVRAAGASISGDLRHAEDVLLSLFAR